MTTGPTLRQNGVRRVYASTTARKKGSTWWSRIAGGNIFLGWDQEKTRPGQAQTNSVSFEFSGAQAAELVYWLQLNLKPGDYENAGLKCDANGKVTVK